MWWTWSCHMGRTHDYAMFNYHLSWELDMLHNSLWCCIEYTPQLMQNIAVEYSQKHKAECSCSSLLNIILICTLNLYRHPCTHNQGKWRVWCSPLLWVVQWLSLLTIRATLTVWYSWVHTYIHTHIHIHKTLQKLCTYAQAMQCSLVTHYTSDVTTMSTHKLLMCPSEELCGWGRAVTWCYYFLLAWLHETWCSTTEAWHCSYPFLTCDYFYPWNSMFVILDILRWHGY